MRSQWKIVAIAFAGLLAVLAAITFQPGSRHILLGGAEARPLTIGQHPALIVTVSIENSGGPDRLLSGGSPEAKSAMLHGSQPEKGLPLPASGVASLAADGAHLMLFELEGEILPGRLVPITLTFEQAGEVRTKAKVIGLSEARSDETSPHAAHGVAMRDVDSDRPPTVSIEVTPQEDGWRVNANVANFRFAPERMDGPHVDGEGHGHLYLNGLKLGRLTSPVMQIGRLPPGEHIIRVSLNANDHAAYMFNGRPIAAEVTVNVPEP